MRWRVCRAMRRSAGELAHEVDVLLHRVLAAGALELRPGLVFRGADEVEEARLRAVDVALGALLVERVQLEQDIIAGAIGQRLDVPGGLFEAALQVGHGRRLRWGSVMTARAPGVVNTMGNCRAGDPRARMSVGSGFSRDLLSYANLQPL